jgi:cell shape-determining protein MreC
MELIHTLLDIKDSTIKTLEDKVTKLEKENQELRAALAFEERKNNRFNRE